MHVLVFIHVMQKQYFENILEVTHSFNITDTNVQNQSLNKDFETTFRPWET